MREIKFRIRDPALKHFMFNGMTLDQALRVEKCFLPMDMVYQQYTGLKDRNWKEIYEGDLINTYPILASDLTGDKRISAEVKWLETQGCWIANWGLTNHQSQMSEVTWNIYENPELIKVV